MLSNLTGWHAIVILAVVLLIFGAAKLPALAKSVGQSVRILKDEASSDYERKDSPRIERPRAATYADEVTPSATPNTSTLS